MVSDTSRSVQGRVGTDRFLGASSSRAWEWELLRDLQQRFPGRYHPSHLRTLQRGVRKIRARLRVPGQKPWQQEGLQVASCDPQRPDQQEPQAGEKAAQLGVTAHPAGETFFERPVQEQQRPPLRTTEEERTQPYELTGSIGGERVLVPDVKLPHTRQPAHTSTSHTRSSRRRSTMRIEQAVQEYLEMQRKSKRRPKTLIPIRVQKRHFRAYHSAHAA